MSACARSGRSDGRKAAASGGTGTPASPPGPDALLQENRAKRRGEGTDQAPRAASAHRRTPAAAAQHRALSTSAIKRRVSVFIC